MYTHCTKNSIYVFPEKELCGLRPNSYIHVPVSDLYNPRIGLETLILEILYECRNWETEHYNSVMEIMRLNSFISGNT
jgi:hypothetical protein